MMKQLVTFTVPDDGTVTIEHDTAGVTLTSVDGTADGRPAQLVDLPDSLPEGHGAWRTTTWDDGAKLRGHGRLWISERQGIKLERPEFIEDIVEKPRPFGPSASPSRLVARGRHLLRTDGLPWNWQGLTAFRLAEMVHAGRASEVDEYCAWGSAHDVTVNRVFVMCGAHKGDTVPYLFRLAPADGRRALPKVLDIAAKHGQYVEVVCCVDTRFYTDDLRQHVSECGAIMAQHENAIGQVANEPEHSTQRGEIADPAFLAELRALIPANVPTSHGPAHGDRDYEFKWAGGNMVTVHFDRANGEDQFTHDGAGLRWVRHIKDGLDTSVTLNKWVANDEPRRNDLTPWKHTAVGALCRMLGMGDTFHYGGGMHGQIPEGAEFAAFAGRQRGWNAIPPDWAGRFFNTGHSGSPVRDADWSTVLKVFCSVSGAVGYVIAIGSADPRFTWAADWPHRELVLREGGTSLYRTQR